MLRKWNNLCCILKSEVIVVRAMSFGALLVVLVLVVAGCIGVFPSGPAAYGISWRSVDTADYRLAMRAGEQSGYIEGPASGYYIPDQTAPLGRAVSLVAWRESGGIRTPVEAQWSVVPAMGTISPAVGTYVMFLPQAVGQYEIQAMVDDIVVALDVTIYPGFVLESADILAHPGGVGYRFDLEQYVEDPLLADIYIVGNEVHVPGGVVPRPEQYLHAVAGPVAMAGATTVLVDPGLGVYVMETRAGEQAVLYLGVTASTFTEYAYVFGYRRL